MLLRVETTIIHYKYEFINETMLNAEKIITVAFSTFGRQGLPVFYHIEDYTLANRGRVSHVVQHY